VRRGRPAAACVIDVRCAPRPICCTRADLARQLIGACQEVLGWDPHRIKVEFTQHSGDEMYYLHLNGFNHDWLGDESTH
jgi:hypothetical protein